MQTFIDLLESAKISLGSLITHHFHLEDSPKAYDLVVARTEPVVGIVIQYDTERQVTRKEKKIGKIFKSNSTLVVSFVGAGNFAQNAIFPRIKSDCKFGGIITNEGNGSAYVGKKYGFKYLTDDYKRIISDPETDIIFVVTRHNTHAMYVTEALKNDKHVFVEKPLAMNIEELEQVKQAFDGSSGTLLLGFNRRFSPLTREIMSNLVPSQLKAINIRVNAGIVPPEHWVHDPLVGGGRILGEVCHFIDLAIHLAGSKVSSLSASVMDDKTSNNDTVVINLKFENGSIATISYFSNGNKSVSKERIEVFANGAVFIIDDFLKLETHGIKTEVMKLKTQDKGHTGQFSAYLSGLKNGKEPLISFDEIYHSSLVTILVLDAIRENRTVFL